MYLTEFQNTSSKNKTAMRNTQIYNYDQRFQYPTFKHLYNKQAQKLVRI